MEDVGAYGKDLSSAEERRAGTSRAPGPGSLGPCLLDSAAGQAADQALQGRTLPACLSPFHAQQCKKKKKTVGGSYRSNV